MSGPYCFGRRVHVAARLGLDEVLSGRRRADGRQGDGSNLDATLKPDRAEPRDRTLLSFQRPPRLLRRGLRRRLDAFPPRPRKRPPRGRPRHQAPLATGALAEALEAALPELEHGAVEPGGGQVELSVGERLSVEPHPPLRDQSPGLGTGYSEVVPDERRKMDRITRRELRLLHVVRERALDEQPIEVLLRLAGRVIAVVARA